MEVGEHLLLELLDEDGVRPHEVLAGGQQVLRPDPHGGRVDPEAVPGAGHAQAHQQHQAGDQEKDGPKRSCHHIDHNDEAWWCGPGVKRVGVSSLKNPRRVIFPSKSSFEIKISSEKFIS